MKERLEGFVRTRAGFENAKVVRLAPLAGGASKQTWMLDLEQEGRVLPLVLRFNRAAPLPVSLDLAAEFHAQRAAHAAGAPTPKPYWYAEGVLEYPFYLLERHQGETLVPRLHRDERYQAARENLPSQLGRALAAIHRATPSPGLPARERESSPALGELDFYQGIYRRHALDPHPALELAMVWLKENPPACPDACLVHGDYRLGNVIFNEQGLVSVLDWELAHRGDPMEDLGYLCVQAWRFGRVELPVGGLSAREPFLAAYRAAGGFEPRPAAMRYWEVFGNFKWAVITILQAAPFLAGQSRDIELAALGRKTAEVELQILALLEKDFECKTAPI